MTAVSPAPPGLVEAAFRDWLAPLVGPFVGEVGELSWSLLAGGRSNLSYLLQVVATGAGPAGGRYVLRRPPLGHVQATAHDMAREHRVQAALAGTPVPVPRMVGLCEDLAVAGAPFYVMEFVAGRVVRDPRDAARLDPATRGTAARAMIDTLAALHAVHPGTVGLDGFGRPEGFMTRQVRRWWTQFEGSRSREVPGIEDLHEALGATVPRQRRTAVVHGDYRLDNLVLAEDGGVLAVLDWEMATLGDPLADVGLLLAYWDGLGGDPRRGGGVVPGPGSGFPAGSVLVERYARVAGGHAGGDVGVDDLPWYVAFGFFKIAVILEGIHYRHSLRQTVGGGFEGIGEYVPGLVDAGRATLAGGRD